MELFLFPQTPLTRGEQAMMQGEDDYAVNVGEEDDDKFGMQDADETRVKKHLKAGLDEDEGLPEKCACLVICTSGQGC